MEVAGVSSQASSSIVKVDTRNYRAIAQENWGLTESQMKGMHVHHRIPRSKGGTNDPSNLYVCSPEFHSRVWHNGLYWAETAVALHLEKDAGGRSLHAVNTLVKYVTEHPDHQQKAHAALIAKRPNHQKDTFKRCLEKNPNHQSEAGIKGGRKQGPRNVSSGQFERCKKLRFMCTVTGHVSNSGGLSRYQTARGIDTSLRVRVEG